MDSLTKLKKEILEMLETVPNVDYNYRLGIICSMKTEEKARELIKWMKENPHATISEIARRA